MPQARSRPGARESGAAPHVRGMQYVLGISMRARTLLLIALLLLAGLGGLSMWTWMRSAGSRQAPANLGRAPVGLDSREDPRSSRDEATGRSRTRIGGTEPRDGAGAEPSDAATEGAPPTAVASGSPPGLDARVFGLATAAVERERDDVHREKMRIVWPDVVPSPPSAGAEMVLIRGYRDHVMVRVVWDGHVAHGLAVGPHRKWLRSVNGPERDAGTFRTDADQFVAAWMAAQLVRGATAERLQSLRPGAGLGGSSGSSSHEPYLWVRLRDEASGEHAASERGRRASRDDVRDWHQIRDRAIHELMRARIDHPDLATAAPLSVWKPFVDASLDEMAEGIELAWGGTDRLLLTLCARVAGEVGDAETLASIGRIRTHVETLDQDDYAVEVATSDLREAARRIDLRLRWTAEQSESEIRTTSSARRRDESWISWVRGLHRARDPEGYITLLVTHVSDAASSDALVEESISALASVDPDRARDELGTLLSTDSVDVQLAAALTLDRLGNAVRALPTLDAIASDTTLRAPTWDLSPGGPRFDALHHILDVGAWDAARVRRQIATEGEDGHIVSRLAHYLSTLDDPLSAVELREAHRRVLDGALDGGLLESCEKLVELDDRPSFPRILERLDAMLALEAEEEFIGRWHLERTIPRLREAVTPD